MRRRVLADFQLGDRDDELAAPVADVLHLVGDFFFEVPGEDEEVVGLGLFDVVDGVDGDGGAGGVAAVFVGVHIDGVVEVVGADAAVVEEGVAFAGGAVADDGFAVGLDLDEEGEEVVFNCLDLGREAKMVGQGGVAVLGFLVEEGLDSRFDGVGGGGSLGGIDAEGTAVAGEFFDVEELEAVVGKEFVDEGEGEVGVVFVVDGVELVAFHEAVEVGEFHG